MPKGECARRNNQSEKKREKLVINPYAGGAAICGLVGEGGWRVNCTGDILKGAL